LPQNILYLTPLTKVEFQSSVAISHISIPLVQEKNIDPACPGFETSCDLFNRSGSRRANP